jgi:hypothetical protein
MLLRMFCHNRNDRCVSAACAPVVVPVLVAWSRSLVVRVASRQVQSTTCRAACASSTGGSTSRKLIPCGNQGLPCARPKSLNVSTLRSDACKLHQLDQRNFLLRSEFLADLVWCFVLPQEQNVKSGRLQILGGKHAVGTNNLFLNARRALGPKLASLYNPIRQFRV